MCTMEDWTTLGQNASLKVLHCLATFSCTLFQGCEELRIIDFTSSALFAARENQVNVSISALLIDNFAVLAHFRKCFSIHLICCSKLSKHFLKRAG